MEQKLQSFFKSGLLDSYIIGTTSVAESLEVEHYIDNYPEVKSEYERLQDNLEILAKADALEAPKGILDNVFKAIETPLEKNVVALNPKKQTPWYSIAASAAAILFAVTSIYFYNQNQILQNESLIVDAEIDDLRSDIENNNSKLDDLSRMLLKLNNPDSRKYLLSGNERAKDLKTVAYINPVEKTSMIDVVELPQLPPEKCYQIWAEVNNRMINLGILDEKDRKLQSIPYVEDALALSISIEPKGGSETFADEENAVAEISLKDN
ncbi:anti-sigma factor [Ichthyenterobacterium sp. W332]|uniref:Anti-sigma factor n=1 Tax=Microcosmobacter mediterraneus TaxID=3075607 RepID=A0ABU2YJG2_9FLAO|nr:anti-sigma factor [Ichthyenterobacterium sp. W332]MDT0558309.1 anti-sigma factor [Ichthyenterobacterium sp. W332]